MEHAVDSGTFPAPRIAAVAYVRRDCDFAVNAIWAKVAGAKVDALAVVKNDVPLSCSIGRVDQFATGVVQPSDDRIAANASILFPFDSAHPALGHVSNVRGGLVLGATDKDQTGKSYSVHAPKLDTSK